MTSSRSIHAFRATLRTQGPNAYVDVPERVSRALSGYARAGRIQVEGRLNGKPIRANLVPVGSGRHRLFVHMGMRGAAGVGPGDAARFELRGIHPDLVRPPADVEAALRRSKQARAVFAGLSAAHRRQMLRWVETASTAQARRRRIQQTVDHLLGKPSPVRRDAVQRPLWTCPRCGNQFVTRNMYHSCKRYELSALFTGKARQVRELFDRFRTMVERLGPVKMLPYRDKVGFMVRVRFAGAIPRSGWLDVAFWLRRRIEHPRFHRVETLTPAAHLYIVRVTEPAQLDRQLASWIREAYAIGCQQEGTAASRGAGRPRPGVAGARSRSPSS